MARRLQFGVAVAVLGAALLFSGIASAQTLYKYRGENGEWIFSDRPPADGRNAETRSVERRARRGSVSVSHSFTGSGLQFIASNRYHAPVELKLFFDNIAGVDYPHPDDDLLWVIPARSDLVLFELPVLGTVAAPSAQYRYVWLPGDPAARPASDVTYRVPYSLGTRHEVTQTFPVSATHRTRDSMYAIDFAMPIGTDVIAARGGVVFEVASNNFAGGPDPDAYAKLANLVRILHDDGTFAVYAHLNRNSIRVQPGDRVEAGEYIADSGNSGFSSGPHLHFAVERNMGMRIDSVPVSFRDASGRPVRPSTGEMLAAHR
ncbi:MAG: M23 family metallopeptidase [Gammaproteobacteria bacterium]|nr:M23 family metallopeptidase [Gammaproteobacteria bacterium]MBT8093696.1 M23 family metallopeptidase [Gammaproteobacteria bacterium]